MGAENPRRPRFGPVPGGGGLACPGLGRACQDFLAAVLLYPGEWSWGVVGM
jgi:hypothetical protein